MAKTFYQYKKLNGRQLFEKANTCLIIKIPNSETAMKVAHIRHHTKFMSGTSHELLAGTNMCSTQFAYRVPG